MSKLTPQPIIGSTRPAHENITWPPFQPPPLHPVFGMTAEHADYINGWYSSVQGAVNTTLTAMGKAISDLQAANK